MSSSDEDYEERLTRPSTRSRVRKKPHICGNNNKNSLQQRTAVDEKKKTPTVSKKTNKSNSSFVKLETNDNESKLSVSKKRARVVVIVPLMENIKREENFDEALELKIESQPLTTTAAQQLQKRRRQEEREDSYDEANDDESDYKEEEEELEEKGKANDIDSFGPDTYSSADEEPAPKPEKPVVRLYCNICKVFFYERDRFNRHYKLSRRHLRNLKINHKFMAKKNTIIPYDKFCKACQTHFRSRHLYRIHIKEYHNNKVPTLENFNFLCSPCKSPFKDQVSYHRHLLSEHNLRTSTITSIFHFPKPDLSIIPDKDDPNCYCKSCDYIYCRKSDYYNHLRMIHHIDIPFKSQRGIIDPTVMPNWYDPDRYCVSCKKYYDSNNGFKTHLRSTHCMTEPDKLGSSPRNTSNLKGIGSIRAAVNVKQESNL